MKFTRSIRLMSLLYALGPLAVFAAEPRDDENPYIGVWRTSSATVTFLLSIREDGTGLFVLIDGGANSCDPFTWKEAPGGILVESAPRLRFWKGRHANEARVEMEPLPPELTSRKLQRFPAAFMMRRDDGRHLPDEFKNRPLPAGWDEPTLPDDWDAKAGQRISPADVVDREPNDADPAGEQDSSQ
jgi:hypothetical protein